MDSPLRSGVASLVRQRGAGDISRDTFFECLAELQTATTLAPAGPSVASHDANTGLPEYGLSESIASREGLWQTRGLAHYMPYNSLNVSTQHDLSFDAEDLEDWSAEPSLLTGEAARALILGTASPHVGQCSAYLGLQQNAPPLLPSMAWLPETIAQAREVAMSAPETVQQQNFWNYDDRYRALAGGLLNGSPYGIASTQIGQEAIGLNIATEPLPCTPPLPGWPPMPSYPASPSRPLGKAASPRSCSPSPGADGLPERVLTPETSFASTSHIGVRQSYEGGDSPFARFAQRSEVWEIQKSRRCQELRIQRDALETAECSFRPNSAESALGGRRHRRSLSSAALESRDYNESSSTTSRRINNSAAAALADRLAKPLSSIDRDALMWRERREREEMQECTFQPNLCKSSKSQRLRASSSTASLNVSTGDGAGSDAGHNTRETRRPTDMGAGGGAQSSTARRSRPQPFAPITNAVPRDMVNARAYLAEDVFSRLMQPSPDSLSASLLQGPGAQKSESSARAIDTGEKANDLSSVSRCRSAASLSSDSFGTFLQRQNACEEWRRERLDSIKKETAPTLRPELCDRSMQLASRHRARCERRNEQQQQGRSGDSDGKESAPEPECSFRPVITEAAKQRERRSLSELSTGDQRRREKKITAAREQQRAKEMKEVPFAPNINTGTDAQSRIRALKEPDSYVTRITKQMTLKKGRVEQERQRRLEKEVEECTFKPKVKASPDFVQRMAESYRLVREQKEKENQSLESDDCTDSGSRPEWR